MLLSGLILGLENTHAFMVVVKVRVDTFDSHTTIDIVHLSAGDTTELPKETLVYVFAGEGHISDSDERVSAKDGDLIRGENLRVNTTGSISLIVVSES